MFTNGDYKLSENLLVAGTVPRLGRPHICAQRWKGEVIDGWLQQEMPQLAGCYLGYNADEQNRAKKADDYAPLKRYMGYNADEASRATHGEEYGSKLFEFSYPLIEWGWTRQNCLDYLQGVFGVEWRKSACTFCPFAPKRDAIERYLRDPVAGGFTLFIEHIALALNPRMHLFSSGTALDLIIGSGNQPALDHYYQLLNQQEWGIYRVQRVYRKSKLGEDSDRCTTLITQGSREVMERTLATLAREHGSEVIEEFGQRFYVCHRAEKGSGIYPTFEEYWVICPAVVKDKCRNLSKFKQQWRADPQLSLS